MTTVGFVEREHQRYRECLRDLSRDKGDLHRLLALVHAGLPRPDYDRMENERPRYDVYRSAAARLRVALGQSLGLRALTSLLGLGEIGEKLQVYGDRVHTYGQALYRYREAARQWDKHAERGRLALGVKDGQGVELYASLKTWEKEEDMKRLEEDMGAYVGRRTEVWILAPVELFLSVSDESFTILVRRLTLPRLEDTEGCADMVQTVLDLKGLLRESWEKGLLHRVKGAVLEADTLYLERFSSYERGLRGILPDRDQQRRYVEGVEKGAT